MTPRICMIIERYEPLIGGSENQCRLLVRALHTAGVPVLVVTRRILATLDRKTLIDGVPVYRLPPTGLGRVWRELFFSLHVLLFLHRRRREYDILHLHSGTSVTGALVVTFARWLRKKTIIKIATAGDLQKVIIEVHDRVQRPSFAHRAFNRWINRCLHSADRIVCISDEILRETEHYRFLPQQRTVIPNAVDASQFSPLSPNEKIQRRKDLGLPNNKLVVLFSGRLIRRKGVDVLLKSWYHLGALHDRGIVVILGSGWSSLDSIASSLKSFAEQHELSSTVFFIEETPHPEWYLQAADIFVFPSRREGLPNAVLEAMSSQLPVIASAIGGNLDLIHDRINGLLFPSEDHLALSRALMLLFGDERLRHRLGRQARHDALQGYSIGFVAQRYLTTYDSLTYAE